jgi:hypothetical protein
MRKQDGPPGPSLLTEDSLAQCTEKSARIIHHSIKDHFGINRLRLCRRECATRQQIL